MKTNGQLLATASEDRTIRLWEVVSGIERTVLRGHEDPVRSCSFSPDGLLLVSGSWDRTIRLWEVASGRLRAVLRGHEDCVNSCIFSTDGQQIISASYDNTLRVWDVERLAQILKLDLNAKVGDCSTHPHHRNLFAMGTDVPPGNSANLR
jgi:WD40 repeat protein